MLLFKVLNRDSFPHRPPGPWLWELCLGNSTSQAIAQATENQLVQGVPYTHPVLLYNSW